MMGRLSISLAVYILLFLLLGGFTACAPAISKKVREEAGEPVPFEALLKRTDGYKGRVVIVGGYILETANETDGSRITVGGKVIGSQERELGNLTYVYPVIEAREIHLWSKQGEYIGPYYPYYDP